jgi:hypothetical protein
MTISENKPNETTPATTPTRQQFAAYEAMFIHFNRELFAGELPDVFLNFSRHSDR